MIVSSQSVTGMASALLGMSVREDTRSVLANTNVPVLIIAGEKDKVINPDQSKIMHTLAKNSHLVMLSGAGHLSNLEQPTKWNDEVIAMFATA
jgi:pimeloyl-ACP methyl ester carboxylesterase